MELQALVIAVGFELASGVKSLGGDLEELAGWVFGGGSDKLILGHDQGVEIAQRCVELLGFVLPVDNLGPIVARHRRH